MLPLLLLAADTAVPALLQFASNNLLELVLTGIAGMVGWAIKRHFDAGTTRTVLSEAAANAVAVIDRDLRPKLQAALADGVLTEKEKGELQHAALVLFKDSVAPGVVRVAKTLWGPMLDAVYKGFLERAVTHRRALQAQGDVARAAATDPVTDVAHALNIPPPR
jgi:hypothetical protein